MPDVAALSFPTVSIGSARSVNSRFGSLRQLVQPVAHPPLPHSSPSIHTHLLSHSITHSLAISLSLPHFHP